MRPYKKREFKRRIVRNQRLKKEIYWSGKGQDWGTKEDNAAGISAKEDARKFRLWQHVLGGALLRPLHDFIVNNQNWAYKALFSYPQTTQNLGDFVNSQGIVVTAPEVIQPFMLGRRATPWFHLSALSPWTRKCFSSIYLTNSS